MENIKVGLFDLTDDRRNRYREEIDQILQSYNHLTLKNFLHTKTLSKVIWEFTEKVIKDSFKEIKEGFNPPQHQQFPELTPAQIRKKNVEPRVIATGGTTVFISKPTKD